jgi:hypothetical protein
MRRFLLCAIIFIFLQAFNATAQEGAPKFGGYPARISRTHRSVKVRLHSTPYTACFRTRLRDTQFGGRAFAGHYTLGYWGCGTCLRVGIVDLLTGRAYVSPFMVSSADAVYHVQPNSRLLIVEDRERDRTSYFLWTGRSLLPIQNGQVQTREFEPTFQTCAEMAR